VKLTRYTGLVFLFAAGVLLAPAVRASGVCPDEPERCVERGATTTRTCGVASTATHTTTTPAAPVVAVTAHKPAAPPAHKPASKPAHSTPLPASATPATPGMGMLLKLSGGTGGDVSWYPSRPADNSGATWVL
jgi:Tfp pilus assembly protein FimV